MSMKRILLYGSLKRKFGREFLKDVATPAEAIIALKATLPGFKDFLIQHSKSHFKVMAGFTPRTEDGLWDPCGKNTIRIVPVVSGAKEAGMGQTIVGAALVAVGAVMTLYGANPFGLTLMKMGTMMMVGGVAQMLAGTQKAVMAPSASKGPDDTPSYAFGGPHMTLGQGNPYPVLLGGPLRIGGALVSVGLCSESFPDKGLGGMAADNAGTVAGNGDTSPWVWALAPVA